MARRLEITVSEETWQQLEAARGFEPRASFVKRALEKALGVETPRSSPAGREARLDAAVSPGRPGAASPQGASSSLASSRASKTVEELEVQAIRNIADSAAKPQRTYACPKATCPYVQDEPGKCQWHPNLTLIAS